MKRVARTVRVNRGDLDRVRDQLESALAALDYRSHAPNTEKEPAFAVGWAQASCKAALKALTLAPVDPTSEFRSLRQQKLRSRSGAA